jgi:basic membrane lipoprotein Med (substrate-binding protein (PBP1-ABC) superfamily)
MHVTKFKVVLLALFLPLFGMVGCGSDDGASPAAGSSATTVAPVAASAEPLKVALVLPSSNGDFGISQGVISGMDLVKAERGGDAGVEIAVSENMYIVDDASAAIRDFASRGYDVVIAASSAYGSSIEEIAPDFPNTSFVWGTNPETFGLDNVYAFSVRASQGGYVGGVMAGMLSDNIGFVGPIDVGSIAGSADGFAAGIAASNPGASVFETFTNSFSDAALASEAARAMLTSDVGVLASQTEMGTGVATVSEDEGVAFFGNDADYSPVAPTQTYASQVFRYEVAFRRILDQVDQGTLGGEVVWLDFANDGIEIVFNDAYGLSDDVRAAGEQAVADIKAGIIEIPRG